MAEKTLLLGIDFGTGGCKVTAIDTGGTVIGEASVEYPTEYAKPGWSEQDPADWYDAMCRALKTLTAKGVALPAVAAVSLDGSTHNAVLLDGNMQVLRKTVMWTDQRSIQECAFLRENYGEKIFATAYQMPTPTWTLPQLRWLSIHEPEVLKKLRHILFVKDYVRYLLTGVAVTDYIEAQGTLFMDMKKMQWSAELAQLAGITADVLPELVKPTDMVGKITAQAAKDTGLAENTPVICGTSDSAAEDYGAGAITPGDCIIKLATAGNVNVMTSEAHPDPGMLTYSHVIPGMWYSVAATNAAALCQRWFRDAFCQLEIASEEKTGKKAFIRMGELAEKSPVGANGVMFHPYLQGERSPYWDPKLRASFTGVAISSGKGDFIRALFEGVAFSLLDCYGQIKNAGLEVGRIFLIGGGARSALWSQIISDVFNLSGVIPAPADASFGTALIAGTGVGIFPDSAAAARKCLKLEREFSPDPAAVEKYRQLFETYREIHDALAPVYAKK